jgi:DNA-binding MarR family transcriptional regulator
MTLEDFVLATLSFFESMSFSKIVFDFDSEILKNFPNFDKDQLMAILKSLEKRGLVKKVHKNNEEMWIKVQRKRSWWRRFLSLFS